MLKSVVSLLALTSTLSWAAVIEGGSVDLSKNSLVLKVSYSGGCEKHDFNIELGDCYETAPVQCEARLVEDSHGDTCEMGASETLEFSLKDLGLNDPYYSSGRLTIQGDRGSKVTVKLPASSVSSNRSLNKTESLLLSTEYNHKLDSFCDTTIWRADIKWETTNEHVGASVTLRPEVQGSCEIAAIPNVMKCAIGTGVSGVYDDGSFNFDGECHDQKGIAYPVHGSDYRGWAKGLGWNGGRRPLRLRIRRDGVEDLVIPADKVGFEWSMNRQTESGPNGDRIRFPKTRVVLFPLAR